MARSKNSDNGTVVVPATQALATAEAAVAEAQAAAQKARESAIADLTTRRDSVAAELKSIQAQLDEIAGTPTRRRRASGSTGGARRGRPAGSTRSANGTLDVCVARVLQAADGVMSPSEITDAVKAAGYTSDSPNFPSMVSQALTRLNGQRMGKALIVQNPNRGEWKAGSGLERYIANPDQAVDA